MPSRTTWIAGRCRCDGWALGRRGCCSASVQGKGNALVSRMAREER
jgi:hypothetical protein